MRVNLQAIRLRVERLAGRLDGTLSSDALIEILLNGRKAEAARSANGEPRLALTYEEQLQRGRETRARLRAAEGLSPLQEMR